MLWERPLHAVLRQELQSTLLLLAQYGCVLPRTCLLLPAEAVHYIASKQGTPVQAQQKHKQVEACGQVYQQAMRLTILLSHCLSCKEEALL